MRVGWRVLAMAAFAVLALYPWRASGSPSRQESGGEPRYQKRRLSEWALQLRDRDPETRSAASLALAHFGVNALETLSAGVSDEHPGVRVSSVLALMHMGRVGQWSDNALNVRIAVAIGPAVLDNNSQVQSWALNALWELASYRGHGPLEAASRAASTEGVRGALRKVLEGLRAEEQRKQAEEEALVRRLAEERELRELQAREAAERAKWGSCTACREAMLKTDLQSVGTSTLCDVCADVFEWDRRAGTLAVKPGRTASPLEPCDWCRESRAPHRLANKGPFLLCSTCVPKLQVAEEASELRMVDKKGTVIAALKSARCVADLLRRAARAEETTTWETAERCYNRALGFSPGDLFISMALKDAQEETVALAGFKPVAKLSNLMGAMNQEGLDALKERRDLEEAAQKFRTIYYSFQPRRGKVEPSREAATCAYNLACAYSLAGRGRRAGLWFRVATLCGFREFEHARKDADLDNLRDEPIYKLLVEGR